MNYGLIDDSTFKSSAATDEMIKRFVKEYDLWEKRQENRNLNHPPDYPALADIAFSIYQEAKIYGY
jgi:hypothetical protein